ncbi:MAG: phosphoenolpyruvate carboxylase [Gammaproteobacteria bacterium]|nr:phosphoenolpyruvate carboxylase [Gammaproteobacteria bacterium]
MSASNPTEATGLHPTARPAEKRKDITFAKKDKALRVDVHALGEMIGELLKEQGGEALYDLVEAARRTAIDRREGDPAAGAHLDALVHSLSAATARNFVRAFSTYFQVVNAAEQVHRIRRWRDYLKDDSIRQPGSFEEAMLQLKDNGFELEAVYKLLSELWIEPVFTADNIEPTRRTILRKQQNIVRRLVDIQNPVLTPQETHANFDSIRSDITTIWQTEEHPIEERTVFDELEHVLFFLTDVIYRAVPPFYDRVRDALINAYGEDAQTLRIPQMLSFASWIGGDMDVRRDITARTMRETLARQRSLILDLYFNECRALSGTLSQSSTRVGISEEVMQRIEEYSGHFPNAAGQVPLRHRDMPYRSFLKLIMERLQSTHDDDVFPYESANEFGRDLQLIANSLRANKGIHAGLFNTKRLLQRVETFGFHFLTVDVRQSALVNRKVVGQLLAEDDWLDQSAEAREKRIQQALESNESPTAEPNNVSRRALAVFQAISFCRRRYGKRSVGPYIISKAHGVDDILSVLLLARWAELRKKDGRVPVDIAPFFETVEDLADSADTMRQLLQNDIYRTHLEQRGNEQIIMVSYSDSDKDAGLASARWSLQQAQSCLVQTLDEKQVDFNLFHGRGGTISRGGGRTHAAVLGSPAGVIRGRLRATEQGELVNTKFGVRAIALRTLEQTTAAVAKATALPRKESPKERGEWHKMMEVIAAASKQRYQTLIYDPPEFFQYFRLATPVDAIERMRFGIRPDMPTDQGSVDNLREIPWDYAWTQSRHMLPGWFGFGAGLLKAVDQFGLAAVREMAEGWYFFRALIYDVETVLAKSDLNIAARYSALAGPLHDEFFPAMRTEFDLSVEQILSVKQQQVLLERQSTLRRSIRLRNPYIDPMSLLQVDLLQRWRDSGREDEALFSALIASINGIARGLQDSG